MPLPLATAFTKRQTIAFILIFLFATTVLFLVAVGFLPGTSAAGADPFPPTGVSNDSTESHARAANAYGKLPINFASNRGQTNGRVRFMARGLGYSVFLTADEAVFALRSDTPTEWDRAKLESASPDPNGEAPSTGTFNVVRMKLIGANKKARIRGLDELPGKLNYFIGSDSGKWHKNVPTYSQVRYRNAYPGIDLVYHGNQHELEYDFIVAPGVSPHRIKLAFEGVKKIAVDRDGDLILTTATGAVRQRKPVAYQEMNGARKEVAARYRLRGDKVSFEVGAYDKTKKLIIDPVLVYSSFLGGSDGDLGMGIAVDGQGSAYLTGLTASTDFPLAGPAQNVFGGFNDAFVVKLNPAGTALIYATYLGGNGDDLANAIAVDAQGSAYVAGVTGSGSFPTTGAAFQASKDGSLDGFVTKLSPSGDSLAYSTFLGGNNSDTAYGVAIDASGSAYVTGRTDSTRFSFFLPLQRNGSPAYKSTNSGGLWSPSSTGLTASAVNAFAIDPVTSNTVYAATNYGVFKSIDAGANWVQTGTGPVQPNAIVVDPSNPNIVYAAAINGVYKSTNGGSTYTVKNAGFIVPQILALAIDPSTPTTLYAGTVVGVYKTTNGGDTWDEIDGGITGNFRVNEVVIDPTNSSIVYMGTNRGMFKTTNGGTAWVNQPSFPPFPQVTALAIDPLNPLTLYAAASQLLFKTIDGGANWTSSNTGLTYTVAGQTVTPLINAVAVDPVNPATLYAATTGGGLFKSTNAGANWSQSNTGLANTIVNAVSVDPISPAKVYAGAAISNDAFAVKLNPSGSALEYIKNFGGAENDEARGVALDSDGNAYIVGLTSSSNFPAVNAFQPASGGSIDAFVTKLNSAGSDFVYSTYLGGVNSDQGRAIAVRAGSAYVTGPTTSNNFPLVTSIKPAPVNFDTDAFVTKFDPSGASLVFSTRLGGASTDQGFGLALDSSGAVYVTGSTASDDFPAVDAPQPLRNGGTDAFVTKLNPAGTSIDYSTYLGGFATDQGNGIAVDANSNAYIIGSTVSPDFPTVGAFQPALNGPDAFVTKIGIGADLSITKTDSRDPVMVNNPLRYTLRATNNGPSPATGVTVSDILPAGLTFVSATPTQGSCSFNSGTVTCSVGSLSAATSAAIVIAVTPTTPATISNTATVTATEPDGIGTNNSATESTKISSLPSINGRVSDASANGVSGVLMTLSGTQTATTQTDADGFYQFAELQTGGNFTVTPSKANLSFNPSARTFNPLNADQTADFLATTCSFTIAPATQSFSAGGGSGAVNVTTLQGCPWTAVSGSDWITITSGANGIGNGTVNFTVSAATAPRAGHLTIAGQNFAVYQEVNSCGTPIFSVATYNFSGGPNIAKAADLNGDGHRDILIATNALSGASLEATVMLNNGAGGFTLSSFDTGMGTPVGYALADFNGDGKPDVAGTEYNTPFVRILFNNGSGGFGQSAVNIPFDSQGQSPLTLGVITADLNGDGDADLLVPTYDNTVQILLGNGAGGFSQIAHISPGPSLGLIDTADFNNDGTPDLLLAADGSSAPIGVMLGNGSGGFTAPIVSTGVDSATSIAVGDFDGDGNLDLVLPTTITVISPPSSFSGIVVMAGDGAGHFVKKSTFNIDVNSVRSMTVGDFNNDGKNDLAFTNLATKVKVLLGDGVGGLGTATEVDTGGNDQHPGNAGIVAADFTGDGRADLAVANHTIGAHVLRNNCPNAPYISGRITDSRTSGGLAGVGITLGPLQVINTYTDSGGNYFIGNLTLGGSYDVVPSKANFKFTPPSVHFGNLAASQTANFVGTPTTVQVDPGHYVAQEASSSIQINVTRSGDLSGVTTVDYTTVNGTASDRSDFTAAVGTLRFNSGEAQKSVTVLLTNDALVEGWESFRLVLSNPQGAIFNTPMTGLGFEALVEIEDNDSDPSAPNPIGETEFFVRQHYHDFLNREPDAAGLQHWVNEIESCGANAQCREVRRINVSAAFFLSIEFQETGYFAYLMYNAAYGETTSPNVAGTVPIIRQQEFLPDTQRMGFGVQVGIGNWQQQLETNKNAYALGFVQRQRFITAFPLTMTADEFVAKLDQNTNGVLSADEKAQLVALLTPTPADASTRASVLRTVAEDSDLRQRELNRAFVLMQFYGYLRRNPDDPQDTDFRGWKYWLDKLNQFNGNFVSAEMVKAFLESTEYRQRFGTP